MKVREISEGALICALVGAFILINVQTGGIISFLNLFLPLPFVYYAYKYGLKNSWIVFFASLLLTFLFSNIVSCVFVAVQGLIGIVYGVGLAKKVSFKKIMLTMIMISIVEQIITILLFPAIFGYNMQETIDTMQQFLQVAYGGQVPSAFQINVFLKAVIIAIIPITAVLQAWVTHYLARLLLMRLNMPVVQPMQLINQNPKPIVGYITLILTLGGFSTMNGYIQNEWIALCVLILGVLSLFYLLFYGIIGVTYYLSKIQPNRSVCVLIAIMLTFILNIVMIIIGFLYITTGIFKKSGGTA